MLKSLTAGALALAAATQPLAAQAVMQVPIGGDKPAPVSVTDPVSNDSPEDIAKDAARDLKDSRFYNRPGATRAQYDADWQACRLIARGSRTPSGSVPYYYNPAVISPIAAGIGGGLGGALGALIVQGQQRRANRRACLLIRGWRLVEVPSAQAAKVAAMTDDERSGYFNTIVGAAHVDGTITERTSFTQPTDLTLALDASVSGVPSLWMGKKVDPAAPFVLAPDEAAVVIAYRRPGPLSAGRAGTVQLTRYDVEHRDLVYRPKDWKKTGDKTVYTVDAASHDGKAPLEVQVVRVTPGDYVIAATAVNSRLAMSSNCFGAPTFHVEPGQVAYLGDFVPVGNARLGNGDKVSTLAYTSHLEDTRRALAGRQPALATALRPVTLRNRATYACSAIAMDRWDVPGVEDLPPPAGRG